MKYRMYVDEVGNPDLESSDNPNHRFLSLTGVILDLEYVRATLHPEMEALKGRHFESHPDDPVIFHRADMVNARGPFHVLKDETKRLRFDEELIGLIDSWTYTVVSVCLDKKRHKEIYQVWRYDPYHYGLAILVERFIFFLNQQGVRGDVMAESRGGKEDRRLKDSFHRLWENGTDYVGSEQFQAALTSRELKVAPKHRNVSGLQLADLIAHPSRNEILLDEGLRDRPLAPFAAKVVAILQRKYYQRQGRIYGRKFVPK
ncbi:MAG: DUF3800 domain-containing protein [Planctomycetota bacterium]